MTVEYSLPPLPLGGSAATIVRWLKQPGQPIAAGDPLVIVANDRVEAALPAPADGALDELLVREGTTVPAGAPLIRYSASERADAPDEAPPAIPQRASPLARRIAAAVGIDLALLAGSGPGGRIVKRDVLAARSAAAGAAPTPPGQPAAGGPILGAQPASFTALRLFSGPHPSQRVPRAITAMEVDLAAVAARRAAPGPAFARRGLGLTEITCVALAAAGALLRYPLLNGVWSGDRILVSRRVHLALAAVGSGSAIPVLRDAQDLNLLGMERAVSGLVRRAHSGTLAPHETSGATFTIAGPNAGAGFAAANADVPHIAVLEVGTVRPRPLVVEDEAGDRIAARPAALLALAYDVRALDQSLADAFLTTVRQALEHLPAWL
jgi:pyruvate/2-oxoglutarate dehydrogenase complex dihydrolipoamide acyltransferase (E2) component